MSDKRRKYDEEFKKNAVKISYISVKSVNYFYDRGLCERFDRMKRSTARNAKEKVAVGG